MVPDRCLRLRLNRSARFYIDMLGFEKAWHSGDGTGTVCQVNRSDCEIILCQEVARKDKARLFVELTAEGLADFRRELAERSVPNNKTWWGYDSIQINDPTARIAFPFPAITGEAYTASKPLRSERHEYVLDLPLPSAVARFQPMTRAASMSVVRAQDRRLRRQRRDRDVPSSAGQCGEAGRRRFFARPNLRSAGLGMASAATNPSGTRLTARVPVRRRSR